MQGEKATLDAFTGARLWSADNQLRFDSGPLEGAVVGGFGAGSDSMWDVMAAVGYRASNTFSVAAGYRMLGVVLEF